MHFTGERVVPGEVDQDLWNEHISRYKFAVNFAEGKRVLDVGCGTGYGTALLAERAAEATGFDVSPDAVSYATSHFGDKANFVTGDAVHYPAANESFDLITAFEVIEHIADYEHLIAEAARVLSHDGIFLVSTPNKPYYEETRKEAGPNPFHMHEFELDEFEAVLRGSFPHVQILAQNQQEAIVFECESNGRGNAYFASDPNVRDAHFFLALCSKQPFQLTPFVYVAQTGNLLRAREHYITLLKEELDRAQADHLRLLEIHEQSGRELETSNQWAVSLDNELAEARQKLLAEQRGAEEKAKWAQDLDQQLQKRSAELVHVVAQFDEAQIELAKRTQWAQDLDQQLQKRSAELVYMIAQFDEAQVELAKRAQWAREMEALCGERTQWAQGQDQTVQSQTDQISLLRDELLALKNELSAISKRAATLESSEAFLQNLTSRLREENEEMRKQLHGGNEYVRDLQLRLTAVGSMADRLMHERELVRASKWLKFGQRLRLGPRLAEEPPPL